MRSLHLILPLAVAAASTLTACGDPPAGPPPSASASTSDGTGTAPFGAPAASASAPAASSATPAASGFALAPPRKGLPKEEREREMARVLAGEVDAQALPLADTEPSEAFDPRLRRALASRAEVRIEEPAADGAGSPELKLVHEALLGRKARLRRCYMFGLGNNPNLIGRVGLNVLVAAAGKPKSVENGGSELPDSSVIECLIAEVGQIAFPAPTSGESRLKLKIMFAPGP